MFGNPGAGTRYVSPFKNKPDRRNNQLWIESTRAAIGKYEYLTFIISLSIGY